MIHRDKIMVVFNTHAAQRTLSEQVADYYIAQRRLNAAHKFGVDFGSNSSDTFWTTAQCYSIMIEPLANYIAANGIECVLMSAGTAWRTSVGGVNRSVAALAGFAPWIKLLGHMMTLDAYKFSHSNGGTAATPATACTISQASPGVVTYTSGEFLQDNIVAFTTDGALPAPLVAGTQYYVVNVNVPAKTFNVAATPSGTPINTTSAGSGSHTVKLDNPNAAADLVLAVEIFGPSVNYIFTTKSYDWQANPYWRPCGRIGIIPNAVQNENFDLIKRIIDDAVYLETVGQPLAPVHFHQHDRAAPYITGLQVERARLATVAKGHATRHSTADCTYTANWPIQPPVNSYGSWINGELSANPEPCGGIVSPRIANDVLGSPWIDSFAPTRGAFILDPTSGPADPTLDFIFAGGCTGGATTGEPINDNQPNTATFMARLLDGMTYAEAVALSTPVGCYKAFVMGDPLLTPFSRQSKRAFAQPLFY